jgi:hypothetical protein
LDGFEAVKEIAKACDGKITEVGILPDNSGFAIMSMPLRKDHWIYGERGAERKVCDSPEDCYHEPPPMPFRMGVGDFAVVSRFPDKDVVDRHLPPGSTPESAANYQRMTRQEFADRIRIAGKYAIRASTMKGKEMDFDPDAMLQNLVVGLLGYWTDDGLTNDEWANPESRTRWCCNGDGQGNHSSRCRHSQPNNDASPPIQPTVGG